MHSKPILFLIPIPKIKIIKNDSVISLKKNNLHISLNKLFIKIPPDIIKMLICKEVLPFYHKKTPQEKIFMSIKTITLFYLLIKENNLHNN
jgi:hypothetical protein